MISLALLLAAQASVEPAASDDFEIVNSITIRTSKLTDRELRVANRYAFCVSMPYFPLEGEPQAKFAKCRAGNLRRSNPELKKTLDHIDYIITQNSGSEASLSVKRDYAPN